MDFQTAYQQLLLAYYSAPLIGDQPEKYAENQLLLAQQVVFSVCKAKISVWVLCE